MRLAFIPLLVCLVPAIFASNKCLIPGVDPGKANARGDEDGFHLYNKLIFTALRTANGEQGIYFSGHKEWIERHDLFELKKTDGTVVASTDCKLIQEPKIVDIVASPNAGPKASDSIRGKAIEAKFQDPAGTLEVDWSESLLDGSNYIRETCTFHAINSEFDVNEVALLNGKVWSPVGGSEAGEPVDVTVVGTVPGSPITAGPFFLGVEHPRSTSEAKEGAFSCYISRKIPITPDAPVTYSAVIGVAPNGQMRRAFLNYVERERAHPYRTFLHYNSWLDISYGVPYNADQCVDSINAFGHELTQKRGVKLESFLFDDGWDNTHTVWEFNSGFPDGFTPLKQAAAQYHAGPGVWLSPWGGYGNARDQRLAAGKAQGYEIDREGYALSGPKYFDRFRQVCLDFVQKYGVNQFKFDGTGSPDKHTPGSRFDSDFDAAIQLIHDLRQVKPDLFINLTTGTWPSPFWLRYADSTWRGGADSDFAGVGTWRQKWITYRDGQTYHGVVLRGPLYPISSLMLHGIIYAKEADNLQTDPGNDFRDEVRSYFGEGTQLQEMYITHSLLTDQNWNELAEAAKWSAANADELVDTHWIGGDPLKLEVYGWAAWCPRKASIVLRNPSDKPQSFSLDVGKALDLPGPIRYRAHSAWREDVSQLSPELTGGRPVEIELKPFEVKTLDLYSR